MNRCMMGGQGSNGVRSFFHHEVIHCCAYSPVHSFTTPSNIWFCSFGSPPPVPSERDKNILYSAAYKAAFRPMIASATKL